MLAPLAFVPALMIGTASPQIKAPQAGSKVGTIAKGVLPPTLVALRSVLLDPNHPKPAAKDSGAENTDPLGLGSFTPSIPPPNYSGVGDVGSAMAWGMKSNADRDLLKALWGRTSPRYLLAKRPDAEMKKAALSSGLASVPTGSFGYPYARYPASVVVAYARALKADYVAYATWVTLNPPGPLSPARGKVELTIYDVATGRRLSPVSAALDSTAQEPDQTYVQAIKAGETFGSYLGGQLYDALQKSPLQPVRSRSQPAYARPGL